MSHKTLKQKRKEIATARKCLYCEKPLPVNSRPNMKFCPTKTLDNGKVVNHKNAYHSFKTAKYNDKLRNGVKEIELINKTEEQVNHPQHYGGKDNPYEAIKVIEAWDLDFCLGNTVKYISRAEKKEQNKTIQDLEKAAWYLNKRIEQLKNK